MSTILNRLILRKTLSSPVGMLLYPGLLFVTLFALLAVTSVVISWSGFGSIAEIWNNFAAIGNTLAGVGTFFIALTLGASFLALVAQQEQLSLQRKEIDDTRKQLQNTSEAQTKNLRLMSQQVKSALLTAKIQSLTSRIRGYEAQIQMVEKRRTFRDTPQDRQSIETMRNEQHRLYEQLDRILNDLQIGTQNEVPPAGTYSDPSDRK